MTPRVPPTGSGAGSQGAAQLSPAEQLAVLRSVVAVLKDAHDACRSAVGETAHCPWPLVTDTTVEVLYWYIVNAGYQLQRSNHKG